MTSLPTAPTRAPAYRTLPPPPPSLLPRPSFHLPPAHSFHRPYRPHPSAQHPPPQAPPAPIVDQSVATRDDAVPQVKVEGVECEICCTVNVPVDRLTFCSSGHFFCKDCARRMAESQIGLRKSQLPCMSMEGCAGQFEPREARRFLDPSTFQLWERIRTEEEIKAAKLDGLESCPFCDYACVIDNRFERLFYCLGKECGKVTCRSCKRKDHIPKSCAENEMELRERNVHAAEERLSAVLVRRCPQVGCQTPILKEESMKSCNRMSCAVCKHDMCYCCRKDVTEEGYRHFDMLSDGEGVGSSSNGLCPLWEDTIERHKKDVEEARRKMGNAAPKKTEAERVDEFNRRRQFEQQRQRLDEGFGFEQMQGEMFFMVLEEDEGNQRQSDKAMRQQEVHGIVMEDRERQKRVNEDAIRRQEQQAINARLRLLAQREDRLRSLGFLPPVLHSAVAAASLVPLAPPLHLLREEGSKGKELSENATTTSMSKTPPRTGCSVKTSTSPAVPLPPTPPPSSSSPSSPNSPISPNRSRGRRQNPLIRAANRAA